MDIRPDYANIEQNGKLEQVDPDEVEIGSVIVVQPGEKVSHRWNCRGRFFYFEHSSPYRRKSAREAKSGDELISGCINMTGLLKIRTTKEFGESTVSKILDLVENASSRKSKSEDFISRFAKIYTPAVCYAALALAILPPLIRMLGIGTGCRLGNIDLPGAYIPCSQLPLRSGDQYTIKFLCRDWRSQQSRRSGQRFQLP